MGSYNQKINKSFKKVNRNSLCKTNENFKTVSSKIDILINQSLSIEEDSKK